MTYGSRAVELDETLQAAAHCLATSCMQIHTTAAAAAAAAAGRQAAISHAYPASVVTVAENLQHVPRATPR